MVTIVLLNVLCTCAMPRLTLRRAFFFLLLAMCFVGWDEASLRAVGPPQPLGVRLLFACRSRSVLGGPSPQSRLVPPYYRRSFTPFLPATVLRGPFRVRAFVFDR